MNLETAEIHCALQAFGQAVCCGLNTVKGVKVGRICEDYITDHTSPLKGCRPGYVRSKRAIRTQTEPTPKQVSQLRAVDQERLELRK